MIIRSGSSLPTPFLSTMPKGGQFFHNSPAAGALAEKVWEALFTAQLSLRENLDQKQWENVGRTKKEEKNINPYTRVSSATH